MYKLDNFNDIRHTEHIGKVSCTLGDPVFSFFYDLTSIFMLQSFWWIYSVFVQSSFLVIFWQKKKYLRKAVCNVKCENTMNLVQFRKQFQCNFFGVYLTHTLRHAICRKKSRLYKLYKVIPALTWAGWENWVIQKEKRQPVFFTLLFATHILDLF